MVHTTEWACFQIISSGYNHVMLDVAATAFGRARFGRGAGPIVLDDLRCLGNETSLMDCPASLRHNCNHGEDAGVRCANVVNHGKCKINNTELPFVLLAVY